MRALHFDGNLARVTDVPLPEPSEDNAVVRVSLAGVCNTDLEIVKGYMGFRGTLGHEFVGVVDEGPREWLGQRVVSEINFSCQRCPMCQENLQRHCPSRRVMGILDADGAFAERVRVPVANLHIVPENVPDEAAVFTEPLAAAFEILSQVEVVPGGECLVLGDGKLGLLVAQALDAAGARVLAVGNHPEKLAVLAERGIETVALKNANQISLSAARRVSRRHAPRLRRSRGERPGCPSPSLDKQPLCRAAQFAGRRTSQPGGCDSGTADSLVA